MDVNITEPWMVAGVLAGVFVGLPLLAIVAVILLEKLDQWIEK